MIINVSVDRIGLGFSYDAFNFRTTDVHAFFMHTFFLFFPILSMFYVLLCSLSFSDRLRHGTQTTQIHFGSNPLQGSGSSSSSIPPIPSLFRFRDEKAKTDFSKNLQVRGVHPEL